MQADSVRWRPVGVWLRIKEKGGARRHELGVYRRQGEVGRRRKKKSSSHEDYLQFTGQKETGLPGCLGQWFSVFFLPTRLRHTIYFHQ